MGSRPNAIAGYGICLNAGEYRNDDDKIDEAVRKAVDVTFDRWHCHDETGAFLSLSHTHVDWDEPSKLNVELTPDADDKLRAALLYIWTNHPDYAQRYLLPKHEEAKFDWFLYAYYW